MEIAGLVVGLYPLCIEAYQLVCGVKAAGQDFESLQRSMNLEQLQFIAIGQQLGIIHPRNPSEALAEPIHTSTNTGLKGLFTALLPYLERILELLANEQTLKSRYGIQAKLESQHNQNDNNHPPAQVLKNDLVLKKWNAIAIMKRLKWTLSDKTGYSNLYDELRRINHGISDLLERRQLGDVYLLLHALLLQKPPLRQEVANLQLLAEEYADVKRREDFNTFKESLEGANLPMHLEDRLRVSSMSAMEYFDRNRSYGRYQDQRNIRHIQAIIEWKEYSTTADHGRKAILRDRITKLGRLLREAARSPNLNLRVLECVLCIDDEDSCRIGYVLKNPSANPELRPATLKKLFESDRPALGARFELATTLARSLMQLHMSNWMHKGIRSSNILFCDVGQVSPDRSGYIMTLKHGNGPETRLDLSQPWLIGFDYSRPTGDDSLTETLHSYSAEDDFYRHPATLSNVGSANPVTEKFRRRHDVYSLGCVLLEIGHWQPLESLWKDKYDKEKFSRRLTNVYAPELEGRCGKIYADAVRHCLIGTDDEEVELAVFYENVISRLQSCKA